MPVIALLAASCAAKVDPCAGTTGTCVVLSLHSASIVSVDRIDVTVSGATTGTRMSTASGAVKLPVSIGVQFPSSLSGAFHMDIVMLLAGQVVGGGQVDGVLQPGQHTTVSATVESNTVPQLDMGADQSADAGDDLAGVDLAGVDLAHDMATPTGPIFGDTTLEPGMDTHAAGLADASNYLSTQAGTVGHLSAYVTAGDLTSLLIGLYDDQLGHPHTLLASGTVTNPIAGLNTATITPVAVTAGTTYWIAIVGPVGSGTTFTFPYASTSGPTTEHSVETNLTSMPATWTTGATFPNTRCSFYGSW
jgi:hypothetical protein